MEPRRIDALSLIAGLLFAGLGIAFALDASDRISLDVGWIWPSLLIGLGLGAILAGARRQQG